MRKIVLLSHGGMAKGLLNTLSIFTANIDHITAISAYVDDCDPKAELERFWTSVNDDDQVVLCTDILGGSVNQLALPYLSRPNTYLFTGMNVPMLLQLTCLDENATEAEIKALADAGREAVVCMNDYEFPQYDDEDE